MSEINDDVKIKVIDSDKLVKAINEGSYDINLSAVMALGAVILDTKKQEPISDSISRQVAVDAITSYNGVVDKSVAKRILIQLPSAQSEQRWIPCSERLPEEHEWMGTKRFGTTISDEVYVTFENPKGERFCKHLSFQNGKLSSFDQLDIDAFYKGSKPIAWKPLPEPYRAERKTDERNVR